jgi:predicted CoA-binding protein
VWGDRELTNRDLKLREALLDAETVAVVGMSRNPYKAAHRVPAYLASLGFVIVPVNPFADEIMGRRSYPALIQVPDRVDFVEVFRPSREALAVVREAVQRHRERGDVSLIWLQSGIASAAGREAAVAAGIEFVQDRCMAVEIPRLFPGGLTKQVSCFSSEIE